VARARPGVLITRRLPGRALDRVAAACDLTLYDGEAAMPRHRLLAQVSGKAGTITLLTDRADEEFLAAAGPQLSVVANYAAGFDNIDLGACTRRGVLATNAPDVLADTAADMAFALMIGAARRAAEDDRLLRSRGHAGWDLKAAEGARAFAERRDRCGRAHTTCPAACLRGRSRSSAIPGPRSPPSRTTTGTCGST
jgi:glyoxylate reductase